MNAPVLPGRRNPSRVGASCASERTSPICFPQGPARHRRSSAVACNGQRPHDACPDGHAAGSDAREKLASEMDPRSGVAVARSCNETGSREDLLDNFAWYFLTSFGSVTECACRRHKARRRRPTDGLANGEWTKGAQARAWRGCRANPPFQPTLRFPSSPAAAWPPKHFLRFPQHQLHPAPGTSHAHRTSQLESSESAAGNRLLGDAWIEPDGIVASNRAWAKGNGPGEPRLRHTGRDSDDVRVPPFPDFRARPDHRGTGAFPAA